MDGMDCETVRGTSAKGQVLELAPRRPWYTNLDVICARLMLRPDSDVVAINYSIQGKMTITKNVFGQNQEGGLGYHMTTKSWIFWRKLSSVMTGDLAPSVSSEAWRISIRLPLKDCPFEDSAHATLPPSIGLTCIDSQGHKVKDFESSDAKVEYQVMASLKYRDGSTESIEIPILFVPLPIVIGQDARVLPTEHWNPRTVEHRFSNSFKDVLQLTFGEMHTTLTILDRLSLTQDLTGFWVDATLTIDWLGKPEYRPQLTSITPSVQIFQVSDQTHIDSKTCLGGQRKLACFVADKVQAPALTQAQWNQLSAGTARKLIHCRFFVASKKVLQPSFQSCLMTRTYQMTLGLNLSFPKSIIRTRIAPLQFPIRLTSKVEPNSERDAPWIKYCPDPNLVREELCIGSNLISEYLECPGRKPSYFESMGHLVTPAPMPRIPLYPTSQISEQEENRIPAWRNKCEARTTTS